MNFYKKKIEDMLKVNVEVQFETWKIKISLGLLGFTLLALLYLETETS